MFYYIFLNTETKLKNDINTKGFIELKNYIPENELKTLRNFVDAKLKENHNQYFFLTSEGPEKTLLNDENFFLRIEDLLKKTTKDFGFSIKDNEKLYKVLRVVTGKKSKKVSLDYHFDAHLLTILIPIYIPSRKNSNNGNLVILKNLRKLIKNIFINIIQKIFYQGIFFKKIFINTGFIKSEILNLVPGNAYIFNGFRTLHANHEINPDDIRATILIHYYDIFRESYLVKRNRELRIKKEATNIEKNKIKN